MELCAFGRMSLCKLTALSMGQCVSSRRGLSKSTVIQVCIVCFLCEVRALEGNGERDMDELEGAGKELQENGWQ